MKQPGGMQRKALAVEIAGFATPSRRCARVSRCVPDQWQSGDGFFVRQPHNQGLGLGFDLGLGLRSVTQPPCPLPRHHLRPEKGGTRDHGMCGKANRCYSMLQSDPLPVELLRNAYIGNDSPFGPELDAGTHGDGEPFVQVMCLLALWLGLVKQGSTRRPSMFGTVAGQLHHTGAVLGLPSEPI